jgi:uncharacterized protein
MIANPLQTIVYLHGFRSSSGSRKARQLLDALTQVDADWEYVAPDLSPDPAIAIAQVEQILLRCRREFVTLVGSSLGGFYALVLSQRFHCRAVLLNPSLCPYETLAAHVGPQTHLATGEVFEFTNEYLAVLRALETVTLSDLHDTLVVVEMGDELLDHRQTLAKLQGAKHVVEAGGDHDLSSFPRHLDTVLAHAGLARR